VIFKENPLSINADANDTVLADSGKERKTKRKGRERKEGIEA
jgi:hypothetical protein